MRLTVKIEDRKQVLKDIRTALKSGDFPLLKLKKVIATEGTDITLDMSYSTILGYSKESLHKMFEVLTENIYNPLINDVFNTAYSQEELNRAELHILSKSIKLQQKETYAEGMDEPSFVDMMLTCRAELFVPDII